jgi:4a-hydroxytetrahydrobiopterin dehydratase
MSVLAANVVQQKLAALKNWKLEGEEIVRQIEFPGFPAAILFVNRVAEAAEAAGHHPDIDIRYNKVRLALVSHDAGGLTDADFNMAAAINQFA